MSDLHIEVVPSALLAERAAVWVADRLWTAMGERGVAHLAVSGGATPVALFGSLATMNLPWNRLHIWQVDERIAPNGSADRNAGQLDALGSVGCKVHVMPVDVDDNPAAAARLPPPRDGLGEWNRPGADSVSDGHVLGLDAAAERYAVLFPDRFDVVHLGLGDDGHTASWPPGDDVVTSCARVEIVGPFNGRRRMTMTPLVINQARHIMFLVSGSAKAAILARLYAGDPSIPATVVRRPGTVILTDVSIS